MALFKKWGFYISFPKINLSDFKTIGNGFISLLPVWGLYAAHLVASFSMTAGLIGVGAGVLALLGVRGWHMIRHGWKEGGLLILRDFVLWGAIFTADALINKFLVGNQLTNSVHVGMFGVIYALTLGVFGFLEAKLERWLAPGQSVQWGSETPLLLLILLPLIAWAYNLISVQWGGVVVHSFEGDSLLWVIEVSLVVTHVVFLQIAVLSKKIKLPLGLVLLVAGGVANLTEIFVSALVLDPLQGLDLFVANIADVYLVLGSWILGTELARWKDRPLAPSELSPPRTSAWRRVVIVGALLMVLSPPYVMRSLGVKFVPQLGEIAMVAEASQDGQERPADLIAGENLVTVDGTGFNLDSEWGTIDLWLLLNKLGRESPERLPFNEFAQIQEDAANSEDVLKRARRISHEVSFALFGSALQQIRSDGPQAEAARRYLDSLPNSLAISPTIKDMLTSFEANRKLVHPAYYMTVGHLNFASKKDLQEGLELLKSDDNFVPVALTGLDRLAFYITAPHQPDQPARNFIISEISAETNDFLTSLAMGGRDAADSDSSDIQAFIKSLVDIARDPNRDPNIRRSIIEDMTKERGNLLFERFLRSYLNEITSKEDLLKIKESLEQQNNTSDCPTF